MNTVEDTSDFGLVFRSIHPSLCAALSTAVVLSGLIESPLVYHRGYLLHLLLPFIGYSYSPLNGPNEKYNISTRKTCVTCIPCRGEWLWPLSANGYNCNGRFSCCPDALAIWLLSLLLHWLSSTSASADVSCYIRRQRRISLDWVSSVAPALPGPSYSDWDKFNKWAQPEQEQNRHTHTHTHTHTYIQVRRTTLLDQSARTCNEWRCTFLLLLPFCAFAAVTPAANFVSEVTRCMRLVWLA